MTRPVTRDPYVVRLGDALGVDGARARVLVEMVERLWEAWAPLVSAHDVALMLDRPEGIEEAELLAGLRIARVLCDGEREEGLVRTEQFIAYRAAERSRKDALAESQARRRAAQRPDTAPTSPLQTPDIIPTLTGQRPDTAPTPDPIGAGQSPDIRPTSALPRAGQEPRADGAPVGAGGITSTPPTAPPTTPISASGPPPLVPPSRDPGDFNPWIYRVARWFGWKRSQLSESLMGFVRVHLDIGLPVEDIYPSFAETETADNRGAALRFAIRRRLSERQAVARGELVSSEDETPVLPGRGKPLPLADELEGLAVVVMVDTEYPPDGLEHLEPKGARQGLTLVRVPSSEFPVLEDDDGERDGDPVRSRTAAEASSGAAGGKLLHLPNRRDAGPGGGVRGAGSAAGGTAAESDWPREAPVRDRSVRTGATGEEVPAAPEPPQRTSPPAIATFEPDPDPSLWYDALEGERRDLAIEWVTGQEQYFRNDPHELAAIVDICAEYEPAEIRAAWKRFRETAERGRHVRYASVIREFLVPAEAPNPYELPDYLKKPQPPPGALPREELSDERMAALGISRGLKEGK